MDIEINDKRNQKEFMGISFSGYKKTEVKKQLTQSILNSRVEPANYWAAELICAGHFLDLWEIIILIANKHIHYGNPKLPIYLNLRFENFKEIMINGYIDNEIKMRNNNKIRELFAEIISILVFSQKKHSYDVQKIQKTDFDLTEIKFRLKADKLSYSEAIFMKDDPKELFIAINELAYSISNKNNTKNSSDACFWIDWILEFDKIAKSKKEPLTCETRPNMPVQSKFQNDIIWILWELFIHEATKHHTLIGKIIKNLLLLFCIHYSTGVKKRRRYILYFVVSLLTEKVNYQVPLQTNPTVTNQIKSKIGILYREIKKNEIKPDTDYLFNGVEKSSLEKTIAKIEKMNNIGFIPRG
jgi:hypothetical protein